MPMDTLRNKLVLFTVGAILLISVCIGLPQRRFLVNCDIPVQCENATLADLCGTDGQTYPSQCHLDAENQHRFCDKGNFNPLAKVHEGKCINVTTTVSFL